MINGDDVTSRDYLRRRSLTWKLIHRYQLTGQQAFCALLVNRYEGILAAARFIHQVRRA